MNVKFGPVHPMHLKGTLRDWVGHDEIMVNSLHGQGIKTLAKPLSPKPSPRMVSSRRSAHRTETPSASACSGILNGRRHPTRPPSNSSADLVPPPEARLDDKN